MKKRSIIILLTVVMAVFIVSLGAISGFAEDSDKYVVRSWDGQSKQLTSYEELIPDTATEISNITTELSGGWYVLSSNVEFDERITVTGTASNPTNIILKDGCTLNAKNGINVGRDNVLNIYGQEGDSGKIVATGDSFGAGIGSGIDGDGGTVTVYGGNVTATGGTYGSAGIGGGYQGNGGTVTVYGGNVTATGGTHGGAGIGSYGGNGGTVTVYGGNVNATGGNSGAGIGGGIDGDGGTVTVHGGTVNATGGPSGAGIGGGPQGNGGDVKIYGGTVTAIGGGDGAGIGGGMRGNGGDVTVYGGTVTATGGDGGAGIGGGIGGNGGSMGGNGGDVKIYGGTVTATGGMNGTGIGKGDDGTEDGTLTLGDFAPIKAGSDENNAHEVDTYGGEQYVQIHCHTYKNFVCTSCGEHEKYIERTWDGKKVTQTEKDIPSYATIITSGTEELSSGWYYVSGEVTVESITVKGNATNIILMDGSTLIVNEGIILSEGNALNIYGQKLGTGTIYATGKIGSAGIGGGFQGNGGNVTVYGGTVIATGGSSGAGIGGGTFGNGGNITVYGGTVNATAGELFGAGIGGGLNGDGGNVTVYGGTVTATGGSAGAGIGGGNTGNGGNVTIYGGTVTATGGMNGTGIGKGDGGEDGTLLIGDYAVIKAGNSDTENGIVGTYTDEKYVNIHFHTEETVEYIDDTYHKCAICGIEEHKFVNGKCVCGMVQIISTVPAKEATCGEDGWAQYYIKNGKFYADEDFTEEIPELESWEGYYPATGLHDWVFEDSTHHKCTVCKQTAEHSDTDDNNICDICDYEFVDEAKADAKKAIHYAVDHSDDAVVILLADIAENIIDGAESVADVLEARDYWLTVINKQLSTAHEHTYSENWSIDPYYHWHNSSCEHGGLTSDFGEHTFDEGVVDGNTTVYTCSECEYKKVVYDNTGDDEGEIIGGASFVGVSLTIGSDISINFFMDFTEEARLNGKMTFKIGARTVTFDGIDAKYNEDLKLYYFRTPLTALEMSETVKATYNSKGVDYVKEYSVEAYIEEIVGNPEKYGDEAVELAKKIANYGHYAQLYLESIHTNVTIGEGGYKATQKYDEVDINTKSAIEALKNYNVTVSGKSDNVSLYGSSVYFDNATALNYYVTVNSGVPTATAQNTVTGETKDVEIKLYKNNIYIVSVKDIFATELADDIALTVNGELTVTGSVFAYCNSVVSVHSGATEKDIIAVNAMSAFYEYYESAMNFANPGQEPEPTFYTVSFDMMEHGDDIDSQTVKEGEKATEPTEPTEDGYFFDGWYADETFTEEWDFDTVITEDTTIYAKWLKTYTVSFEMMGHGTAPASQIVGEGKKATEPTEPTAVNYLFYDWYADANFTAEWNFDTAITEDTIIYAKWVDKQTVLGDLKAYAEAVRSEIENFEWLDYEKEYFLNELSNVSAEADMAVALADTKAEVDLVYAEIEKIIDSARTAESQAELDYKENAVNDVDYMAEDAVSQIDDFEFLSDEQKFDFKTEIDNLFNSARDNILSKDTKYLVDETKQNVINQITFSRVKALEDDYNAKAIYKDDAKTDVIQESKIAENTILGLQYLSNEQKKPFIEEIESITTLGITVIESADSKTMVDYAKQNAIKDIDTRVNSAFIENEESAKSQV